MGARGQGLVALILALVSVGTVGATTIPVGGTTDGNDCSGVFGTGFNNCAIPADTHPVVDHPASPVIIKFSFASGVFSVAVEDGEAAINSALFPTISGGEFSFDTQVGTSVCPQAQCGTWIYDPLADGNAADADPAAIVTFWAAKGGPSFNLYTDTSGGPVTTGTWFTPLVGNNGNPSALSHITFYDTGASPPPPNGAPEPGTLLLAGAALAALGMLRRRRT
jgi:hypothetical protein